MATESIDFTKLIRKVNDEKYLLIPVDEYIKVNRDECPVYGHTAGDSPHNWEELEFRGYKLRNSSICTEAYIAYYCDVPSEFTCTLELTTPEGKHDIVWRSITNTKDPSAESKTLEPQLMQPWLDVVLKDALKIEPTHANWRKLVEVVGLRSFIGDEIY